MLGLFNKNLFLGVDIGTSSIKVVELKLDDKVPSLTNYAWISTDGIKKGDTYEISLSKCLSRIIEEGKFKSKKVNIAVPSFGGLITLLEFPGSIGNDLDQAVKFEAYKYIPTPMEEVILSWDIVGGSKEDLAKKDSSEKIQVMLVAASRKKVSEYENIVKNAGLELQGIEIENFSMMRSLIGNDQGSFIILDIGSRVCNIILIEKGIIRVNRNIDAGGIDITRSIAQSMRVSEERAEGIKKSNRDFFSKESNIAFPVLDSIAGEVSRAINSYYKTAEEKSKINALILSGGTANLLGLDKYLSNKLEIKTVVGNPFSRLNFNKKLEPLFRKNGTQFSVAIGLALKGGGDNK
jgi:type IV pilus assembly protein PilM